MPIVMKRIFLIILIIVVGVGFWVCFEKAYLAKHGPVNDQNSRVENGDGGRVVAETGKAQSGKEGPRTVSNAIGSSLTASNSIPTSSALGVLFGATVSTNIDEWKIAVPGLKLLNPSDIMEVWAFDGHGEKKYVTLGLTASGGRSIDYVAALVIVRVKKPGDQINRIELQAPYMTIEEIKAAAKRLNDLLELDEEPFQAWANQVGNQWMDQPVFASKGGASPDPLKDTGYTINRSFHADKPWFITFIFSDK